MITFIKQTENYSCVLCVTARYNCIRLFCFKFVVKFVKASNIFIFTYFTDNSVFEKSYFCRITFVQEPLLWHFKIPCY